MKWKRMPRPRTRREPFVSLLEESLRSSRALPQGDLTFRVEPQPQFMSHVAGYSALHYSHWR